MQFVDRVVREILRLYPYVTYFPATAKKVRQMNCVRLPIQDFVVEGFNVHEGSLLLAGFYSTNHDEKVYSEPGKGYVVVNSTKNASTLIDGLHLAQNVRRLPILCMHVLLMV